MILSRNHASQQALDFEKHPSPPQNSNLLVAQESFRFYRPQSRKALSQTYPVSESFKVIEGFDIYRSQNLIIALVVVESGTGKDLRLYRWQKRQDQWKVDLCRMSVTRWNWSDIAEKAAGLVKKYEIRK